MCPPSYTGQLLRRLPGARVISPESRPLAGSDARARCWRAEALIHRLSSGAFARMQAPQLPAPLAEAHGPLRAPLPAALFPPLRRPLPLVSPTTRASNDRRTTPQWQGGGSARTRLPLAAALHLYGNYRIAGSSAGGEVVIDGRFIPAGASAGARVERRQPGGGVDRLTGARCWVTLVGGWQAPGGRHPGYGPRPSAAAGADWAATVRRG